jgi:hypothetical protein
LKRNFGVLASLFGSILWLVNFIAISDGGNYTEIWALPLQFLALYLFSYEKLPKSYWNYFLIGIISASLFLLQSNLIGVPISIFILLLVWRYPSDNRIIKFKYILTIFISALSILLIVIYFFKINNAFSNLLDAVVIYSFCYSTGSFIDKILNTVDYGTNLFTIFLMVSVASWLIGLSKIVNNNQLDKPSMLVILAVIDLPIELFLTIIPGRAFLNYYIAWLPVLSILVAYFVHNIFEFITVPDSAQLFTKNINIKTIFISILIIISCINPIHQIFSSFYFHYDDFSTSDQIVEYINALTSENESVLMWGCDPYWNFLIDRKSPTRYIYQLPLFTNGYTNNKLIGEFFDDIIKNKPTLIIDTYTPWMPPINSTKRTSWVSSDSHYSPPKDMDNIFKYFDLNYEYIGTLPWSLGKSFDYSRYDVYRNKRLYQEP